MSFLSKAVTKKRIEPVTIRPESTIDPSVWEPTASPQVMAAVLDSALRLSLVGVVSRTQRGTFLRNERMPGLAGGRVTSSFPSQIVIHRGANRTWLVSQGLFLRDGQTFIDWTVAVKLEETGVFTVATPEYLTIDGALAHSHNYSELRNALEVSLRAVGSMVSIAEQEIASSELAKPLPGGFAGHVGERAGVDPRSGGCGNAEGRERGADARGSTSRSVYHSLLKVTIIGDTVSASNSRGMRTGLTSG